MSNYSENCSLEKMSINNLCNPPEISEETCLVIEDTHQEMREVTQFREDSVHMDQGTDPEVGQRNHHGIEQDINQINQQGIDQEIDPENSPSSEHFLDRVSNIPIVNSALRAYEQSKANSYVVKYGAETVESSVKSICRPVINKLEPQLGQIDDFACRQLDKLEHHYSSFMDHSIPNSEYQPGYVLDNPNGSLHLPPGAGELRNRRVAELSANGSVYNQAELQVSSAPSRSRWQQVVLEAGITAGAGVAVFSEESMRGLRYCQQWLLYASAHIERQVQLLTNYISSLSTASSSNEVATYSATATFLANIKKEVVATLRKVVDVVSRYASSGLPGEARSSVRNFILSLPSRWASLNVPLVDSNFSTPCSSPLLTPNSSSFNSPTILTPTEHANRVLSLANESMTMLHNVGDIFKDTVYRAEGWLHAVGMAPPEESMMPNGSLPHFPLLPPPGNRSFRNNSQSSDHFAFNQHPYHGSFQHIPSTVVREPSSDSDAMC